MIKMIVNFSSEKCKLEDNETSSLKCQRKKLYQPRNPYLAKLSFENKDILKSMQP